MNANETLDPGLERCWTCDTLRPFLKGDIVINKDKLFFVCGDCR